MPPLRTQPGTQYSRFLSLQRGISTLLAAAFVPSRTPSSPPAHVAYGGVFSCSSTGKLPLSHPPCTYGYSSQLSAAAHSLKMTTSSQNLGRYARPLRGEWPLEPAVALNRLLPKLSEDKHKGQLGRVGVFGGSKDYTGAPFFASMSALRMGADLAYVFTAEEAAAALKTYSPELMVTPVYSTATLTRDDSGADQLVAAVGAMLPKLHSLLLGPGLGRDPHVLTGAAEIVRRGRKRSLPAVLDADSLTMVLQHPDSVKGYPLAVLTPNVHEFGLLRDRFSSEDSADDGEGDIHCPENPTNGGVEAEEEEIEKARAVERLAKSLGGVTVILKGKLDIISDGERTIACAVPGGLKRCGGIGDVLSGAVATAMAWVSLQKLEGSEAQELRLWAAWWGCAVTRHASRRGYEAHGRAMSATNVFENIGSVVEDLAPSPAVED